MFEHDLQNLGLSEKEARIYLAALELGPSTVQDISRKTGLIRTTVYNLIDSLKEKGLMSEIYQREKRLFTGQNPERLLSHIRLQKKELEEREKALRDILPELKGLADLSRYLPKIRFFQEKEGIRCMQDDMANTKGLTCIEEFIPIDDAFRLFPPHRKDHRHQMLKALNRTLRKVIYASDNGISLPAKEKLVETKLVRSVQYRFSSEINIYGNKVAIVMFERRPLGLIIEADEIAESLRSIFYLVWKKAKMKST